MNPTQLRISCAVQSPEPKSIALSAGMLCKTGLLMRERSVGTLFEVKSLN